VTPIQRELATISRLATPVVATQLGSITMWVVDVVMVGAVGVEALDAAALGRLWIMGTMIVSMGIVLGIDPLVAQAHGAGDSATIGLTLQRGLVIAFLLTIPNALLWAVTERFLLLAGQDPVLAAMAGNYVRIQLPLLPLFLAFTALRQYLAGRGIMAPTMWVMIVGNGVNVFANWVLIYGNLGAPRLELVGAGISTALTWGVMVVALLGWILVRKLYRGAWDGWTRRAFDPRGLLRVVHYGLPVGIQLGLELWAFVLAMFLAGWLGVVELASHTIVINLASISFMVPLGVAIGTVTRVGNLIGEGRPKEAQLAAWVAIGLGAAFMTLFAVAFMVGRNLLPRIYTADGAVIALSASLLPIAAAFQLFDGVQAVGGGVLRGMGKTRPAAVINLVGYYALALPIGYVLAFRLGMGMAGIWWGLAIGLAVVAVSLVVWVWRRGPARVDARVV
jgi:MATE family multidrug resistance protein